MRLTTIVLLIVATFAVSAKAQTRSGIEGVWKLGEVTTTGENAATKQATQPSMYLFTKKHYSIIYVRGDAPRAEIADAKTATADDLRKVFVDDFIANAGTYEMKGGKLTLRPVVAKAPGFMKPGNYVTYAFKVDGNTMTITNESTNNGPVTNPTTVKLTRVE